MLGLQTTGPGLRPHRQPPRCGRSPALSPGLGVLLSPLSGRFSPDVRQLGACAKGLPGQDGGRHDQSV
nr:MAG TPA: hypothetical protein [Caudoviricetes sp.]